MTTSAAGRCREACDLLAGTVTRGGDGGQPARVSHLPIVPILSTIEPNMGTYSNPDRLAAALFGKVRQGVLARLYGRPDEALYVREVVRQVGAGHGAVQRELRQLADCGILTRRVSGRQVYYQANRTCPVFDELFGLTTKTAGVAGVIAKALEAFAGRIDFAFIYGSIAAGRAQAESDVDVMVCGRIAFSKVASALRSAGVILHREVNTAVFPPTEFRAKVVQGHHFLKSVTAGPKLFVIGDDRDVARLSKRGMAQRARDIAR